MRFLIAFLLCYIVQFQYTHAAGLTFAAPQKSSSKAARSLQTFKGVSPLKPHQAFSKDFMEQRCASQQQHHTRINLNGDFPTVLNIPDFQVADLYLAKLNFLRKYDYSFLFNFLYPKHAFW